jgi:hypothetical protein
MSLKPTAKSKGNNKSKPNTTVPAVDFATPPLSILQDEPAELDRDEDYPEDYPDYYSSLERELIENSSISILEKREDVRGNLAILYTVATFLMFVLGFVVSVLDAVWRQVSIIENLSTILPLISGIFLGSLGFVLGYYFRKIEGDEKE